MYIVGLCVIISQGQINLHTIVFVGIKRYEILLINNIKIIAYN